MVSPGLSHRKFKGDDNLRAPALVAGFMLFTDVMGYDEGRNLRRYLLSEDR